MSSGLQPYVIAACVGHPGASALQAGVTDEPAALALLTSCLTGTYSRGWIGDRELLIPNQDLKLAQRTLHRVLTLALPKPAGVPAVAHEIQGALPRYGHFIRTDIQKCYANVLQAPALEKLGAFLSANGWDGPEHAMLMRVGTSLFPEKGMATGAPASPYMLEVLLHDLPGRGTDKIIRYVDDFLILQAAADPLVLYVIAKAIQPLGLNLSASKTQSGETKDGFSFLGRIFGNASVRLDADTYAVDVNAFLPMTHWRPKLAVTASGLAPAYSSAKGVVTFRLDSLFDGLNKGSVDALCLLACVGQVPELEGFARNRGLFYSQEFAHGLHGRIYSGYVANVKEPRESGGRIDPVVADKILAGLALSAHLQKTGRLPETHADMDAELGINLSHAFAASSTGDGDYHSVIKSLFKQEHGLRVGGSKAHPTRGTVLPGTAPVLTMAEPPSLAGLLVAPAPVRTPAPTIMEL